MRTNSNASSTLIKTSSAQKLKDNNIVMNSILKVRHNKSNGQYCNCLLQRNQTELTTLTIYKSKKPLSETQRSKTKIWFTVIVTSSLTVTKENTMSKYIFHIADGGSLSSFSSRSAYNRDSWVQTLQSCNHTATDEPNVISKGNPYGRGMYDHTGTSPFSSRKSLITTIAGPRNRSRSASGSSFDSDGLDGQLLDEQGRELTIAPDTSAPEQHKTPSHQHGHALRQQSLKKSMSEKVKPVSNSRPVEKKSAGTETLRKTTSLPETSPTSTTARLSRRHQFLEQLMVEMDNSAVQKSSSSDFEDEFDYVPRSSVKISRHHVQPAYTDAALSRGPTSGLCATPASHLKYSGVDTPCVTSSPASKAHTLGPPSVIMQTPAAESKLLPAHLNFSAMSKSGLVTPAHERTFALLSQSAGNTSTVGSNREVRTCWQPPVALPPGKNYSHLQ